MEKGIRKEGVYSIKMKENLMARLLTDEYAEKILVASYYGLVSAQELSERFEIPIAACYRKIHELEKVGLLRCEKEVTSERGKPVKLYASQLRSASYIFENGTFRVRFELPTDQKIHERWIELKLY